MPGFSVIYSSSWISRSWNGFWQGVNQPQPPKSQHSRGCIPAGPLAFLLLPVFTKTGGKPKSSAAPEMLPTVKALPNSIKDGKNWIWDEKLGGRRANASCIQGFGIFLDHSCLKAILKSKLCLPASRSMDLFLVESLLFLLWKLESRISLLPVGKLRKSQKTDFPGLGDFCGKARG